LKFNFHQLFNILILTEIAQNSTSLAHWVSYCKRVSEETSYIVAWLTITHENGQVSSHGNGGVSEQSDDM
jgi:hypothetical protein